MTVPAGAYVGTQFLFPKFYSKAKNFPIRLQVEGITNWQPEFLVTEIEELPR